MANRCWAAATAELNELTRRWRSRYQVTALVDQQIVNAGESQECDNQDEATAAAFALAMAIAAAKIEREQHRPNQGDYDL